VNPDGTKCPGYPNLKVLAISRDGGSPVAMTKDNVANRSYPLTRDAYIYVDKAPGQAMSPKVREFLRFVLSREGQEIIQKYGPYTNLPADTVRQQLKKLD
jgi:phosphate transport system substrate-binding protein